MTKKSAISRHKQILDKANAEYIILGFLGIGTIVAIIAYAILTKQLAPVPAQYLETQKVQNTLSQAEMALHKAHLSEDHESLLKNLYSFSSHMKDIRADFSQKQLKDLPAEDSDLKEMLRNHGGFKVRLDTYLYVIDNAHKEFLNKLNKKIDQAYFNLVSETDRSNSVSGIVNNFVTPLISTAQLGTDVNLIVANLERAGKTQQKIALQNLKESTDKALKRINASFNLHKGDPTFSGIEDITYQITSFAHGPNNIFEIKQNILTLEQQISKQFEIYDSVFASAYQFNKGKRSELARNLVMKTTMLQNFMIAFIVLNLIVFAGAISLLVFKSKSLASTASVRDKNIREKPDSVFYERLRDFGRRFRQSIEQINLKKLAKRLHTSDKKKSPKKNLSATSQKHERSASTLSMIDQKVFSSAQKGESNSNADDDNESMAPLLLDTTMRIEAQRQKLKQALSELDESKVQGHARQRDRKRRNSAPDISIKDSISSPSSGFDTIDFNEYEKYAKALKKSKKAAGF